MSNKQTMTFNLDSDVIQKLQQSDNRSALVNRILKIMIQLPEQAAQQITKAFTENQITMDYIGSRIGIINYNEIVSLGIEAYADKIKKERGHQIFAESMEAMKQQQPKRRPLKFVIEDAIGNPDVTDWNSLMEAVVEAGYEAYEPDNQFNVANRPLYYEKQWLMRQTVGVYTLDTNGGIIEA